MIVTVVCGISSRKIDATVAAPGPHDFAVRCFAVVAQRKRGIAASIAFRPDAT